MASALNEITVLEEIKEYMPNFCVSLKDVQRPTSEFVIRYWLEALKQFGVDVDMFRQPTIIERTTVSSIDGHMMFVMKLHKCLDYIFTKLGTKDFTVCDLLQPNPVSFWIHIGIMRNFYFFHVRKAENLNEAMQRALNVKDNYQQLLITFNELKEKCNQMAMDRAEKPVYLEKLNKEIEACSRRLIKLREEITELQVTASEHKDHFIQQDIKIMSLKNESQKHEEEKLELRQQLVSSPDHVIKNLEELESKEQNLKEQCSSKNEEESKRKDDIMKFEKYIININNYIEELKKYLALLKDNSVLQKKVDVSKWHMEEREEKLTLLNVTLSVCTAEIEQLKEEISVCQKSKLLITTTAQQKMKDLNMELQNKKAEAEEYLNMLQIIEPENKDCFFGTTGHQIISVTTVHHEIGYSVGTNMSPIV